MAFTSQAQDYTIVNLEKSITVKNQQQIKSTFSLQNYTKSQKTFQISINPDLLKADSKIKICHSGDCNNSTLKIVVSPNSRSEDVEIVFQGGLSNYKSSIQIEITDLENNNSIYKDVAIQVTDQINEDIFYQKNDIIVNSFFPNPAGEFAIMNYSISPYENDAKIILQNVLGSIIDEYRLDPKENKLRLRTDQLKPGVYFYTLTIRDEGLATRKLIINK